MFAYQLAVVVDDAAMGVTEVVRGADLLSSTPRQLLLYRLLGLKEPVFCHFPLLLDSGGRRLSKRNVDAGLDTLGERYTAPEILGKLAYLAGFNPSAEPRTGESCWRISTGRRCRGRISVSRRGCSEKRRKARRHAVGRGLRAVSDIIAPGRRSPGSPPPAISSWLTMVSISSRREHSAGVNRREMRSMTSTI